MASNRTTEQQPGCLSRLRALCGGASPEAAPPPPSGTQPEPVPEEITRALEKRSLPVDQDFTSAAQSTLGRSRDSKQKRGLKLEDDVKELRKRNPWFAQVLLRAEGILSPPKNANTDAKGGNPPPSQKDLENLLKQQEKESCAEGLTLILETLLGLCKEARSEDFASVLFLLDIAIKIVITLSLCQWAVNTKGKWKDDVKALRNVARRLSKENVPIGAVNLALSILEIGITSIRDNTENAEAAKHALALGQGILAAFSFKFDAKLIEGALGLVKMGAHKLQERQANKVFHLVVLMHCQACRFHVRLAGLKFPQQEAEELKAAVRHKQQLAFSQSRWELVAAFADTLANMLMDDALDDGSEGDGQAVQRMYNVCPHLVGWIITGDSASETGSDTMFLGLTGLTKYGEPAPVRKRMETGSDVPIFALEKWTSRVVDVMGKAASVGGAIMDSTDSDNVEGGIELLRSEITAAMESARQQVQEFAQKIVQNVMEELATVAQAHLKTLVANAIGKKKLNEKAVDEVTRCFKTVRKALQAVKGGLEKVKPALKQSSGVARKLHSFLFTVARMVQNGHENPAAREALSTFLKSRLQRMINEVQPPQLLDDQDLSFKFPEAIGNELATVRRELQRRVEVLDSAIDFVQRSQSVIFAVLEQVQKLKLGTVPGELVSKAAAAMSDFEKMTQKAANTAATLKSLLSSADLNATDVQDKYTELLMMGNEHVKAIWDQLKGSFKEICKELSLQYEPDASAHPEPEGHGAPRDLQVLLLRIDQLASSLDSSLELVGNLSSVVAGTDSQLERVEEEFRRLETATRDKEALVLQIQTNIFGALDFTPQTGQDSDSEQTLMNQLSRLSAFFSKLLARFDHLLADVQSLVDSIPTDIPNLSGLAEGMKEGMTETLNNLKKEGAKVKVFVSEQVGEVWEELSGDLAKKAGAVMEVADDAEEFIETYSGVFNAALDAAKSVASLANSAWGRRSTKAQAEMWRARDRAVFQLMQLQAALDPVPDKEQKLQPTDVTPSNEVPDGSSLEPGQQPNGENDDDANRRLDGVSNEEKQKNLAVICESIMSRRIKETMPGVKKTLESTNFAKQFQRTMKEGLKSSEAKIKEELMDQMKTVVELENKLRSEPDPTKRQVGLITLHKERATLRKIFGNVQDVNAKLNVMLETMHQMSEALEEINAKLDALMGEMKELRQDIRRLVGLPPLDVLEEYRKRLKEKGQAKKSEVYIELECFRRKENGEELQKEPLMDTVKTFLESKSKGCMLVSGRAGSGKSVFASKLEQYILGEYWNKQKARGTGKT
eukprot:1400637-Rhodomonas_salina.2